MSVSKKLDELVGEVEELLTRLPANLSPEVDALRDRVDSGIFDAWTAIAGRHEAIGGRHEAIAGRHEAIAGRHDLQPRAGAELWTILTVAFLLMSALTFAACATREQSWTR